MPLQNLPLCANLELTTRCNLRCAFCPHTYLHVPAMDIEWRTVRKFAYDLQQIPATMLVPVGLGEFVLHPEWHEIIEFLKAKFPGVPLRLVSNGLAFDADTSKTVCSLLGPADSILFSMNAWDEATYRSMMGADRFRAAKANIEAYLETRNEVSPKSTTLVQIIGAPQTAGQIDPFRAYWRARGATPYVRRLETWGGGGPYETACNFSRRYPCPGLYSTLMVDCRGNAYPCCEALADRESGSLCLGSIHGQSLKDLYTSPKYHAIRENHMSGRWGVYPECRECDFWASSRLPVWERVQWGVSKVVQESRFVANRVRHGR